MRFRGTIGLIAGACVLALTSSAWAASLPICKGGHRAERKLTCIVDGDTGWENGVKWRYEAIDAPELAHPGCSAEKTIAIQSRDRLRELMGGGYTINWSGEKGRYNRQLVTITLDDGGDVGEMLMNEHLVQPWPNRGNAWCDR